MFTSAKGRAFIRTAEGCVLRAYQDQGGVWTIGVGHTGGVTPGMVITTDQADALLSRDLKDVEKAVSSLVQAPLSQNQFDALVSFTFNAGIGALRSSTLLRKLNAKDYKGAADEFLKWNKIRINGKLAANKGLTARRAKERDLFNEQDHL